jgi:hypothetical protein
LVNGKKIGFEKQPDLFLLLNRVRMKAWFLHDSVFKVPKSFGFIKFSWAHASTSPKESALTHLLVMLIQVGIYIIVDGGHHQRVENTTRPDAATGRKPPEGKTSDYPL